jgi:uncharacterized phosphosugar-binding protein
MFEYVEKINAQLLTLATSQAQQITIAAEWFSQAIINERIIHAFGTGHSQMVAMECSPAPVAWLTSTRC